MANDNQLKYERTFKNASAFFGRPFYTSTCIKRKEIHLFFTLMNVGSYFGNMAANGWRPTSHANTLSSSDCEL